MTVLSLIGGRPQFIKEAVLCKALQKEGIEEILVNSGQHYDFNMSDIFLKTLDIPFPKYNLEVGSGTHAEMTGKIMVEFEELVQKYQPDMVLVYGDTNTTLAGAIVAAKLKVPIGHVEAGVRMEPKDMPEEINRTLTDHASTHLFCATERGVKTLKKEGISTNVYFSGDVMYDLFLSMCEKFETDYYKELGLKKSKYIVVTLHRDYNVDKKETFEPLLSAISKVNKEIPVVWPIHPRSKKRIEEFGLEKYTKDIVMTEPLDYFHLMGLLLNCHSAITDSGGVQKEAYFAGKRSILPMPYPAWVELVEEGVNDLCTADTLYDTVFTEKSMPKTSGIFGDGSAGEQIAKILKQSY